MAEVIVALIVAGVSIFAIISANKAARRYLENVRHETDLTHESKMAETIVKQQELELKQAEAARRSEVDSMTTPERAELEKARLKHETAEELVAAEVTTASVNARFTEEERVIAARTEARVLRARELEVQRAGVFSEVAAIMEAYGRYVEHNQNACTLGEWLGDNIEIENGHISY